MLSVKSEVSLMYLGKEVICSKMKLRGVWNRDHSMAARANISTNIKQVLSALFGH